MNFKKLEEIRKRAKTVTEANPGRVLLMDTMNVEREMAKDILWLCEQIDRNVPKKMSKKERECAYREIYPVTIEEYGKSVLKAVRDFKPTKYKKKISKLSS